MVEFQLYSFPLPTGPDNSRRTINSNGSYVCELEGEYSVIIIQGEGSNNGGPQQYWNYSCCLLVRKEEDYFGQCP